MFQPTFQHGFKLQQTSLSRSWTNLKLLEDIIPVAELNNLTTVGTVIDSSIATVKSSFRFLCGLFIVNIEMETFPVFRYTNLHVLADMSTEAVVGLFPSAFAKIGPAIVPLTINLYINHVLNIVKISENVNRKRPGFLSQPFLEVNIKLIDIFLARNRDYTSHGR